MLSILTVVSLLLASFAGTAQERPSLMFREDWKELPAATPVTQEHVANPALTLHRYGPGKDEIKKSHHDQPKDDPYRDRRRLEREAGFKPRGRDRIH